MAHVIDDKELIKLLWGSRKPVMHWIKQNSGSSEDAEDTVQEAMIICFKLYHQGTYAQTVKPSTLLYAVAKKVWLNQLRKNKRMTAADLDEDIQLTDTDDIEAMVEKEEQLKQLEQALQGLGDKCRQLLEMFYCLKMDMVSIAEKLGFRNDKVAKAMKYKCLEQGRQFIKIKKP